MATAGPSMSGSMSGMTCAITGPTHGIGRAMAEALAARGARVLLLCRNVAAGDALAGELMSRRAAASVVQLDLASLESVAAAAGRVQALAPRLDVLLNNAGVINNHRRETQDGLEEMFAVNHLGHFLLTLRLLPQLAAAPAARIVHTASGAHAMIPRFDFADYNWTARPYRMFPGYAASKLANVLFNQALAQHLGPGRATSNAFHPGWVGSQIGANNGAVGRIGARLLRPFARTLERGAETGIYLACDPAVAGQSGGYFKDCRPVTPAASGQEPGAPERLWELSERLLRERGFSI